MSSVHSSRFTRRQFVAAAGMAALAAGTLLVSGCNANEGDAAEATVETDEEATENEASADDETSAEEAGQSSGNGILVAYFSATGHTEGIANMIAQAEDADVFVMEPKEPYSSDDLRYSNPDSRVSQEHDDLENTHVELLETAPENFDDYDVIFLGFPLWWGHASWVINDFVTENDFEGKTIVPFCTSASSGYGDNTEYLEGMASTGTWLEGNRFSASASEEDVQEWLDSLDLDGAANEQDQEERDAQTEEDGQTVEEAEEE